MRIAPLLALLAVTAAAPALSQGSDTCGQAQAISGTGLFSFDNSAATAGPDAGCAMGRDVWFRWTASVTRPVTVSTCGWSQTQGLDPALAVYDAAACPPSGPLACEDDTCGVESEVAFAATAGEQYLLRVGTWASAPFGGSGFIEISVGGVVGGCPNASVGANVIAGDLDLAMTFGDVSGTSAYSFATTACNVGDEELAWVGQSPDHPVVAHGVYRYENGRFEQIGAGWAKHGFAALQRELCCACEPSQSISALGVGCSDPYSAFVNGVQVTLGPRAEVDPFSGALAWPIGSAVSIPAASSPLDRRVQVATEALDPALHPAAVYLVEAVYSAGDDARALNGHDNASHRPYRRTGGLVLGAHELEPVGVTERALPAIDAWSRLSPTALVREVRVPGEGTLWVGSDARPTGGGSWAYELCVFNLSSQRGVASIELDGGAGPRALGMVFPRAHSGEPRRNDVWPGTLQGERIRWAAPAATSDPEANAILWGTAFSFWFECDSPPTVGACELEFFRGAGPPSVSAPMLVPRATGAPESELVCSSPPNSSGARGTLVTGSFDGAARRLGLVAVGLPPNTIGMVIASRDQASVPMAGGSSGTLCLGGVIGRSVGQATALASPSGTLSITADLGAIPQGGGSVAVQPGESWFFQCWHRDVPQTSNFSEAIAVRF